MAKIVAYCIILLAVVIFIDYKWTEYKDPANQGVCDSISDDRGPLIIESGGKVQLAAGGIYEYTNILIMKGGLLEFIGDSVQWTILRSKGDFTVAGTIRCGGFLPDSSKSKINLTSPAKHIPEGIDLTFTYGSLAPGGTGGAGGRPKVCVFKSDFMLACLLGENGKPGKGGKGSDGITYEQRLICQKRGSSDNAYLYVDEKNPKIPCQTPKPTGVTVSSGKGGESGASYGTFGGLLYLYACGNFNGSGGTIDVSGGTGEKGAAGQSDRYTGGGGAGGGPGGSGGKVYLNVTGELSVPNINIQGGVGGPGGKGGVPHELDGLTDLVGQPGGQGKQGKPGAVTICEGGAVCKN